MDQTPREAGQHGSSSQVRLIGERKQEGNVGLEDSKNTFKISCE